MNRNISHQLPKGPWTWVKLMNIGMTSGVFGDFIKLIIHNWLNDKFLITVLSVNVKPFVCCNYLFTIFHVHFKQNILKISCTLKFNSYATFLLIKECSVTHLPIFTCFLSVHILWHIQNLYLENFQSPPMIEWIQLLKIIKLSLAISKGQVSPM